MGFEKRNDPEIKRYMRYEKRIKFDDMQWNTPFDLDLRVIVITYNHAISVLRLLESLNEADYLGDKVAIDVWIDRSKDGVIHEETYVTTTKFKFKHGAISVYNQTMPVGNIGQWMKTWIPSPENNEIAVILEDDLTVSKYFYKWLKNVHAKYDSLPYINGYSLQGNSIKHGGTPGQLRAPEENIVFVYPVLGTSGFSPNQKRWIKYIHWYERTTKTPAFLPIVPGILPTKKYKQSIKQGTTEHFWSIWHIYHAWRFKERTLYPNLPGNVGLTVKWSETGKLGKFNNSGLLLKTWNPKFENLPDEPIHLNVNGKVCPRYQYL
ncbi:hypothetical protein KP79_PYT00167 [Mizuhopecten yessoensis]|uniref:Glycosyltransferase 2-like domain-containing protein n=1 Tax=Mizuhopecten yessoensis TaxID=6573 RepID=A0A210R4D2_MIZYE|nr:hypothetical protein KP79_PYT00167 [Mizuhopecten yessoensis]